MGIIGNFVKFKSNTFGIKEPKNYGVIISSKRDKNKNQIFQIFTTKGFQQISKKNLLEKDLGKKLGYGNVVTEEMLGQKKPLTLADISQNIGKFLFEGPAKQMERARDEGVGYFDMTPMERFEVASGPLTEIIPGVGFAPDIIKGGIQIARPAGQSILKSIDELTAPLNEIEGVTDTGVSLRVGETTEKSKVGGEVAGITNKPPRQIKVLADSDPDLSKLIVKGDDGKDYVLIGSNTNNRLVELDKVKLVKKRLNESDRNPRDQYYFDLTQDLFCLLYRVQMYHFY